jgi:hypothetical protein
VLRYFKVVLRYFRVVLRYFRVVLRYFKVVLRYFRVVLEYFRVVLEYFRVVLEYFRVVLRYFRVVLRYFKLCRTEVKYTGAMSGDNKRSSLHIVSRYINNVTQCDRTTRSLQLNCRQDDRDGKSVDSINK